MRHLRPGTTLPARPETRMGEPGERQGGRSNNVRSVDIAGVAETMTAMLVFTDSQLRTGWAASERVPDREARRFP